MFWLADTWTGARRGREGLVVERDRQHYIIARRASEARAEAFAHAFAWIGGRMRLMAAGLVFLAERYRRHRRKRAAIRELNLLDDHMLSDIGVSRDDIPEIVAALLDRTPVARKAVRGRASRLEDQAQAKPTSLDQPAASAQKLQRAA